MSGFVLIILNFFYSSFPGIFLKNLNNNIDSRQLVHTAQSRPSETVITSEIASACNSGLLNFTSASDNAPFSWQWVFTGAIPSASTDENPHNVLYPATGEYAVQLIACGVAGCDTVTANVTIDISAHTTAAFAYSLDAKCDSFELKTINLSQNATEFHWNFGDGTLSAEVSPGHNYLFDEDLVISLIATNGNCSDTAIVDSVLFKVMLFDSIPNVITPNGDGLNDCFQIEGIETFSECLSIDIYTRWGLLVFSSVNQFACWNGTDQNNVQLPDGSYFYIISVDRYKRKGTIEIVR